MAGAVETLDRRFEANLVRLWAWLLGRERRRWWLRALAFVLAPALLVVFCFGVLMLATLFSPGLVPIALAAGTLPSILLCRWGGASTAVHAAAIALPAVLVPVVGLLGVDVLWASAHRPRPDPGIGLLLASGVVGGLAFLYLRWLRRPAPKHPEAWTALGVAGGLVLYVVTREHLRAPELEIWVAAAALLAAVYAYLRFVAGPTISHPLGWAVVLVIAVVFTVPLVGPALLALHADVAAIVGFAALVAALALNARAFTRADPRVPALLRRQLAPLLAFALAVAVAGIGTARIGAAGAHPEGHSLPAAVAAKVPPVAIDHRPILLFDSGEALRTPVDVEHLFRSQLVELCPDGAGPLEPCPTLTGADGLTDAGDLRFKTESFDNDTFESRIYVHVVPHGERLYLDYWWYLPDNPANTARGAMCGAGVVIPEITCFDHQSDWEGVTVVLNRATGRPEAVNYAAHRFVVRVPWRVAQGAAEKAARGRDVPVGELDRRPVVFIARGTHAAYAKECRHDFCRTGSFSNDNQFDGRNAWPGNGCRSCVSLFPATKTGEPASWNAFPGRWGTAICLAKDLYCARSDAPRAPWAQNGRFRHPWCVTNEVVGRDLSSRPRSVGTPCARQG